MKWLLSLAFLAVSPFAAFAQLWNYYTTPVTVTPTVTMVQHATVNSQINLPNISVGFKNANTAGNWISVSIFCGQSSLHSFTITDTLGNVYLKAITTPNTIGNSTLGIFFAENIKAGKNTIKIVPDRAGYLRVVIREYSGMALSASLDTAIGAQGTSNSPNTGTVTVANNVLLIGAATFADAQSVSPGTGYVANDYIPFPPGTKLVVEHAFQALTGPASASVHLGSTNSWAIGMASFKTAP